MTPVQKKGDLSLVSNYRPISLLNSVAKLFVKLVFKYLYNHLQENKMLSSLQSGFIPGDSTVNQHALRNKKNFSTEMPFKMHKTIYFPENLK